MCSGMCDATHASRRPLQEFDGAEERRFSWPTLIGGSYQNVHKLEFFKRLKDYAMEQTFGVGKKGERIWFYSSLAHWAFTAKNANIQTYFDVSLCFAGTLSTWWPGWLVHTGSNPLTWFVWFLCSVKSSLRIHYPCPTHDPPNVQFSHSAIATTSSMQLRASFTT